MAEKGDTVLIRANTVHQIETLVPGQFYVLKIKPTFVLDLSFGDMGCRHLLHFTNALSGKMLWKDKGLNTLFYNLKVEREIQRFGFDMAMKHSVAGVLLTILRDVAESAEKPLPKLTDVHIVRRIYTVVDYVNLHYQQDVTAQSCAKQVYMSYSYFSRCFRQVMGTGFKEYLNNVRMNQAEKLLLSTHMSISEIAYACGYNQASYFILTYRNLKGVTPLAFRKKNI